MSRELRISLAIPLPDDAFAQTDLMARLKPIASTFIEGVCRVSELDLDLESRIVNQVVRGPKRKSTSSVQVPASGDVPASVDVPTSVEPSAQAATETDAPSEPVEDEAEPDEPAVAAVVAPIAHSGRRSRAA